MRKLVTDDSSNVRSVTYDVEPGTDVGFIVVEFTSGGRYRYGECTLDDFRGACAAPSLGRWVRQLISAKSPRNLVDKLSTEPTPVDLRLFALRAIASVDTGPASVVARDAVADSPPPPLPPGYPTPYADVAHRGHGPSQPCGDEQESRCERSVRWREIGRDYAGMHLGALRSMSPDEARAVAHAINAAALRAEFL